VQDYGLGLPVDLELAVGRGIGEPQAFALPLDWNLNNWFHLFGVVRMGLQDAASIINRIRRC
jgi:hypothetical protein